ncbi:hypothetical protein NQZ68_018423 [Dissostichus eleginoides]|nr:hypothetical protein NQZ68_018423 [Dissostichus eleginoides]
MSGFSKQSSMESQLEQHWRTEGRNVTKRRSLAQFEGSQRRVTSKEKVDCTRTEALFMCMQTLPSAQFPMLSPSLTHALGGETEHSLLKLGGDSMSI